MLAAIATGLAIGLVLGLTGAGGSVLALPLLVHGLGLPPGEAVGVSLGAVLMATLAGLVARLPRREIAWAPSLVFAGAGMVAAPWGLSIGHELPPDTLLLGFILLMLAVAARMAWQALRHPAEAAVVRAADGQGEPRPALCLVNDGRPFAWRPRCLTGLAAGGLVAGFLSGLFGVGGGFIIVPLLTLLTGISLFQAIGSSLFVIAAVSSTGFATFLISRDGLPWPVLLVTGTGAVLGMLAGTRIARRVAGPPLQWLFAGLILAMAAFTGWRLAATA